ncbi:thiol-disulfide oxidoreductase ResA [Oceanobacillus alkalisoli]|uniref:thiol-disulfide oxidoreductase ResA n=1 Tax=Oceanobacillus alkalisoli TaxID=2925113 RepID=UPI001EF04B3D|nr:thiol-disulfide oxidoreductase ResA [Oceanobacillus alkalisoli]MCF3942259.1 thiol-disulfide oxidoreductase ResA [Oceanobacillus alkalisoli]MCG5104495.1 thiol-disulfide oxidoreductase ResA [Oceanobacillus alkalisoli]
MSLEQKKQKKRNKKRNRLIYRTAVLLVLLGAIIFAIVTNLQADNTVYRVGDQAPDFQLPQINKNNESETIQLSDLRGKGVMLNFWATWCKPCEREMPYMQELYPVYKERGIEIVAVSLDSTELVVDRFIDKYDLTFPTPHDKSGEVRDLYKVGPIPSTFFISPEGEIVEYVSGELSLERLEGYLRDILPQK